MNELSVWLQILIQVGAPAVFLVVLSLLVPSTRKRLWGAPTANDGVDDLRSQFEQLQAQYERDAKKWKDQQAQHVQDQQRWQVEKMQLYQRIVESTQRVDELEKKVKEWQEKHALLEAQIGSRESKGVTVLGIWSGDDFDTMSERDAIYDAGFEYRSLTGAAATRANILRELRSGNIAIIEVGAHGDADAILINQQELTAGWWRRALKDRGIRVAVILACFSDSSVADAMKQAGVKHVIGVSGEIADTAAVEFAQQFYLLFAAGMTVERAFDEAKLAIDYREGEKLILR